MVPVIVVRAHAEHPALSNIPPYPLSSPRQENDMTEYDTMIWALRYGKYDDAELRRVIEAGGEHGALARRILNDRASASLPR